MALATASTVIRSDSGRGARLILRGAARARTPVSPLACRLASWLTSSGQTTSEMAYKHCY